MSYHRLVVSFFTARALRCAIAILSLLQVISSPVRAATVGRFLPAISVEERYNDNIYLSRSDTRSDWITTVSPGFAATLNHARFNTLLAYKPGFVYFLHNPQLDYTAHDLRLEGDIALTSRLKFVLGEYYTRSNEPEFEEFAETERAREVRRDSRFTFNRNVVTPGLEYRFGTENSLRLNYRNTNYRSEDPTEDDYREHSVESVIEYWFDAKNGLSLVSSYTKGNFDIDPDMNYNTVFTPRYTHRFTRHVKWFGEYTYSKADFDETIFFQTSDNGRRFPIGSEDREDYDVNRFRTGFGWQLPRNISIEGSIGYFWRNGKANLDDQGIVSSLAIEKKTENLTLQLEWKNDYSSDYFASIDSGFSKFWSISATSTYTYRQRLEWKINGSYGYEDYKDLRTSNLEEAIAFLREGREDYQYRFGTSVSYTLLRNLGYLSRLLLEVEYFFAEVDSDRDEDYYINNQTAVRLTATF